MITDETTPALPARIETADQSTLLVGRIASLQVGLPRAHATKTGRVWESAIVKQDVAARVTLSRTNLAGDRQADTRHHGGPDKAVCCYSAEHYPEWRALLGVPMPHGAFGENFTTLGLTEDVVCIGDVFCVGSAPGTNPVLVQVSQPRQPCANISRRWDRPDLPRRMEQNGRTGCYLRVLREGEVGAGDTLTLQDRPHPGWTLLRANEVMYMKGGNEDEILALANLAALSAEWRRILHRKLRKQPAA